MSRPDLSALGTGIAILVLGVLLFLQEDGTIDLGSGWLLAALTACTGVALIASGVGARRP